MANKIPILMQVEFFRASYQPSCAKVPSRNFSSLTYRKSGEVSIFTTNTKIVSKPHTLTFLPAGCAYETQITQPGEMLILHYRSTEDSQNLGTAPMTVAPQQTDGLLHLFERGIRHYQGESSYACMADAYRLLSEAEPLFFPTAPKPYRRMANCKQYLDEHVCDVDLRICDLAALFGTSEVYFRKEFKKFYRLSPIEYVKKQRMELACQLLRTKLYSVTEVAMRVGFDSVSYFSAEFHRSLGVSPREYRDL